MRGTSVHFVTIQWVGICGSLQGITFGAVIDRQGLFYNYPGKFTLGLASAQSFVRAIRDSLPPRKGLVPNPVSRRRAASIISPSPYFRIQTHYLEEGSRCSLRFKSRLM